MQSFEPQPHLNEGLVYFCLRGVSFDPDIVTDRLGVSPSRIVRKGYPSPKLCSWEISSGWVYDTVIDVYAMSSAILLPLLEKADLIRHLAEELGAHATLQISLRYSTVEGSSTPAIGFGPDVIGFLARAGASIDVDTYLK